MAVASPRSKIDIDERTLLKAKTGDHIAFTKIVKRYQDMVFSFAFNVCRDKEQAEETLQDTFINVFRKLNQFDGKSKFSTWLYSIVTNNCLMKKRKRKIDKASIGIDELSSLVGISGYKTNNQNQILRYKSRTPLDEVMNKELKNVLDEAIQKLPFDYRVVFVLRDIEGRSAEETSKILNLTIPAVKSRLRRARMFLRNILGDYVTV